MSYRDLRAVVDVMPTSGVFQPQNINTTSLYAFYGEGWGFSQRFEKSLTRLAELTAEYKGCANYARKQKDFDAFRYL